MKAMMIIRSQSHHIQQIHVTDGGNNMTIIRLQTEKHKMMLINQINKANKKEKQAGKRP